MVPAMRSGRDGFCADLAPTGNSTEYSTMGCRATTTCEPAFAVACPGKGRKP